MQWCASIPSGLPEMQRMLEQLYDCHSILSLTEHGRFETFKFRGESARNGSVWQQRVEHNFKGAQFNLHMSFFAARRHRPHRTVTWGEQIQNSLGKAGAARAKTKAVPWQSHGRSFHAGVHATSAPHDQRTEERERRSSREATPWPRRSVGSPAASASFLQIGAGLAAPQLRVLPSLPYKFGVGTVLDDPPLLYHDDAV